MFRFNKLATILFVVLACSSLAYATGTPTPTATPLPWTTTTLSAAMVRTTLQPTLASCAGVTAPGNLIATGGIGAATGTPYTLLYVDTEAMLALLPPGTTGKCTMRVQRGVLGTPVTAHNSGATVYVGPASQFDTSPHGRQGACDVGYPQIAPVINVTTKRTYACVAGVWTFTDIE